MAPQGKRKRGDRSYSYDDESLGRPSPHRPQNLALGSPQQNHSSPRGGRRGSRNGGRGGYPNTGNHNGSHNGSHNGNHNGSHNGNHNAGAMQQSPTAMSPPVNTPLSTPRPAPPPTPSQPQPPKEPPFKPSSTHVPESNEHLTPARVANWSADARNAVVQAAIAAQRAADGFNLNIVFFEIIHAAGERLMSPKELGSVVRDIVTAPSDDLVDPVVSFLDCISSYKELDPHHAADRPYTDPIQQLLIETSIDPNRMRHQLEEKLLQETQLVRPTFHKIGIRATTNAMYRQANYNLLREETEGYSKLMTEYFTTVNSQSASPDVASVTFERVNALIGTFDLDVGRVLDVTLDVFANLLVKHHRFFIKYLRVSTWWPAQLGTDDVEWQEPEVKTLPDWALPSSKTFSYTDEEKDEQIRLREARDIKFWKRVAEKGERTAIQAFFELGSRPITRHLRETDNANANNAQPRKSASQEWAEHWIADTGTLPPLGNEVAAQLLGFKLQFYASDLRDANDSLPDNLIYLAALLIKIGFISITDLWEHLYPQGEDLEKLQAKLIAEKEEKEAKRRGKTANALTMAGALSDDGPAVPALSRLRDAESKPPSKQESERNTPTQSDEEPKPVLPEPVDQKVALLRSLLCIGAIPEALFIIGRNKWMLDLYPDLHPYIFRLAHHSLSKVYESSRPVPPSQVPNSTKGSAGGSATRASDYVPRRTLRWAKPELRDAGDGIDYRFYWDDWADNVPICQTVDDVFLFCYSFLGLVGPECGRDVLLLTKLARIGKKSIMDDSSSQNKKRWSDLLTTLLMPAITFTGENPGVVNEMWELLKRFDTATRYTIYYQWEQSFKPAMKAAFKDVIHKTNQILNRISNTNTKQMGRAIAKLAYACPVKVFKQALERGQQYMNMIEALVACSNYLTEMGYDCLTFSLVVNITSGNRPTTQSDGMLTEGWLKNAAIFVAKVYTKYSGRMDPRPILEYISSQLLDREGELFVMKVLEELITSMGGVSLSGALSEESVLALCAGPRLRRFTLEKLGDNRYKGFVQKPAERLMNHFRDSALAPPILIALADQVQAYLYRENQLKVPDKVVLFNFDNLKLNFMQFLEFLRHHLTTEDFDTQIPNLVDLMSEYYLETEFAFHIARDSIAAKANTIRLQPRPVVDVTDEDAKMEEAPQPDNEPSKEAQIVSTDENGDVEMGDAAAASTTLETSEESKAREGPATTTKPNAEIESLVTQLQAALPDKFGNHPCPTFHVTFWQLSLHDVQEPKKDALKKQYQDAKERTIANASQTTDNRRKPSDINAIREARKDAERFITEHEDYVKEAELIQSSLRDEMHFWFPEVASMDQSLHMTLLQDCFLARARMSLQDAQYSAAMLFFMHKSKVPKFRLIKLLDDLFNTGRLSAMFFSMSEDESKNIGRFMNDILYELGRWHSSEDIYKQFECVKVLNDEGRPKNPESFLKYHEFRSLLAKWLNKVHDALHACLRHSDSGDKTLRTTAQYTELRNSINILKAVAPSFPRTRENAATLKEDLKFYDKETNEPRSDIRVAASSLQYEFKRNEKRLQSHNMFTSGKEDPKEPTPARSGTPASARTPDIRDQGLKKLSASAQSFQPKAPATNGFSKLPPERNDSEDRKMATTASNTPISTTRLNGHDSSRLTPHAPEHSASQQLPNRDHIKRPGLGPNPTSVNSTPVPPRPDSRAAYQAQQASRVSHNLPTRPDTQPLRPRLNDRPGERLAEYGQAHGRHDTRINGPSDYGRLDRPSVQQGRSVSPGRQSRPRSQDRATAPSERPEWPARETRDYDERSMRGPAREVRAPADRNAQYGDSHRDHRDNRDSRDQRDYRMREPHRERNDSRGPPQLPNTPVDSRSRPHAGSLSTPNDTLSHRRDTPGHHNDRSAIAARTPINAGPAPSINPQRAALIEQEVNMERGPPARTPYTKDDRVNPERATHIPDNRSRNTPGRSDRDGRDSRSSYEKEGDRQSRDVRGSFPEAGDRHGHDSRNTFIKDEQNRTPSGRPDRSDERDMRRGPPTDRHDERTLPPYFGNDNRNDNRRDYRDDRSQPQPYPNTRDRREEFSSTAPTGPRSGRDGPSSGSLHVSREMFQPSQSTRPVMSRQDPSYGRLNQPSESIPSGPRNPSSDSRDIRSHAPAQVQNSGPIAPQQSGVHPSRMSNFDGPGSRGPSGPLPPPLQTDIVNAPSGPRGSGRTPLPSPSTIRGGPPTGPAGAERHVRRQDSRNQLGAINTLLSQSGQPPTPTPTQTLPPSGPPPERSGERSQGERGHRRDEKRSREDEHKGEERSREKRDGSRRDRESRGGEREGGRESSHRERSERSERDRRDDRRKDDRERERGEKRSRDPKDQLHGDSKRSRR